MGIIDLLEHSQQKNNSLENQARLGYSFVCFLIFSVINTSFQFPFNMYFNILGNTLYSLYLVEFVIPDTPNLIPINFIPSNKLSQE